MSEYIAHEEEYKGHKIEIHPDDSGSGPREWDNICIFHIGHRRYSFGDVNHSDAESMEQAKKEAQRRGDLVYPLFMYDHSGITISLTPFQCRWDSGQVGFVVVPRLKMLEEFGGKYFAKKLKARGLKNAESEVKTLDQYITGDVYGFKVLGKLEKGDDDDDNREELDACWGYYGQEEAIGEAKSIIDGIVEEEKEAA